jgi:hypothetical protein
LHSKIHLRPDAVSVRPLQRFQTNDSISMGASYGNAFVYLSTVGPDFYARIGSGGPNYKIEYTYGWGYKQRYLVRIDSSYYILPIQWNLAGYLDNSSGAWATYNPNTWFKADGSRIPTDSIYFRKKSWDKNCMGCHVTGGSVTSVTAGADTQWVARWAANNSDLDVTVGCEACHGPSTGGSGPNHQMNPVKLSKQAKLEVCGQCHNRASSWRGAALVGTHEYNKNELDGTYFNPADITRPLSDFMNLTLAPNGSGGRGTWVETDVPRQHHQQYQDMIGSLHYTNTSFEITCFTCHTSHKPTPNQKGIVDSLQVGASWFKVSDKDNTLCLACHESLGSFDVIQKAWVQDPVTFNDFIADVVNQHTRHNVYDPMNLANTGGSGRCSKCHMTKTAITAKAYDISTHTWGVISPELTLQHVGVSSPSQGMINSCAAACHRNPAGSTSAVPSFGVGTDPSLNDWREATDQTLADTLWRYWQAWGLTGVQEVQGTRPTGFALSQNYPNPFNASTSFHIDVPQPGRVRLTIYNSIGQKVVALMDGEYNAGQYEVTWNGKDAWGQVVASGMYLYRAESGEYVDTKKMLMLK